MDYTKEKLIEKVNQDYLNSLKTSFNAETFFVLKFNAKPIIKAATINCKEFPERNGSIIFDGIASVSISKIVRFPITLSPIWEGKIPILPGLNK